MFGLIVSGRLVTYFKTNRCSWSLCYHWLSFLPQVKTDFQQISERQFVTTVLEADNINHIVVFLTGTQAFPEGLGGSGLSIYL